LIAGEARSSSEGMIAACREIGVQLDIVPGMARANTPRAPSTAALRSDSSNQRETD
jgi:hypothetical protein